MSDTTKNINEHRPPTLSEVGASTVKSVKVRVDDYFNAHKARISAIARTGTINVERLLSIAKRVIRENPRLQECTVSSLFGAIIKCAEIGLEPNTQDGLIYLIPRSRNRPIVDPTTGRNKTDDDGKWMWEKVWEVHVQTGYKGLIEVAVRDGAVRYVKPVLVYANDAFKHMEGTAQRIDHEPSKNGERGEIIKVYAVAKLANGEMLFDVMDIADVNHIRDTYSDSYKTAMATIDEATATIENQRTTERARTRAVRDLEEAEKSPWIREYAMMARKTMIIRLYDLLPKTPRMREMENISREGPQSFGDFIDGEYTVDQEDGPQHESASQHIEHQQTTGQTLDDVGLGTKEKEKVTVTTDAVDGSQNRTVNEPEKTQQQQEPKTTKAKTGWWSEIGISDTRAVTTLTKSEITIERFEKMTHREIKELKGAGENTAQLLINAQEALKRFPLKNKEAEENPTQSGLQSGSEQPEHTETQSEDGSPDDSGWPPTEEIVKPVEERRSAPPADLWGDAE